MTSFINEPSQQSGSPSFASSQPKPEVMIMQPPPQPQPGVCYPLIYNQGYQMLQPQTTVVIGQPVAVGLLRYDLSGVREFTYDLCDCCGDCQVCCYGWFCIECMEFDIANSLGEDACCTPAALNRQKIRHQYRIRGSGCADCCVMKCFPACAYCQMYRELKHNGDLKPCCC